jgi:hypothetical protein
MERQRMRSSALAAAVVVGTIPLAATALAQTPANTSVSGQVRPVLAQDSPGGPWCSIADGSATLQASDSSHAMLSLPEVTYFDGNTYYMLDDQLRLVFTNTDSGTIEFKEPKEYPLAVTHPIFTDYDEIIKASSNQFRISFAINFPNCTLPILVEYEAS